MKQSLKISENFVWKLNEAIYHHKGTYDQAMQCLVIEEEVTLPYLLLL